MQLQAQYASLPPLNRPESPSAKNFSINFSANLFSQVKFTEDSSYLRRNKGVPENYGLEIQKISRGMAETRWSVELKKMSFSSGGNNTNHFLETLDTSIKYSLAFKHGFHNKILLTGILGFGNAVYYFSKPQEQRESIKSEDGSPEEFFVEKGPNYDFLGFELIYELSGNTFYLQPGVYYVPNPNMQIKFSDNSKYKFEEIFSVFIKFGGYIF